MVHMKRIRIVHFNTLQLITETKVMLVHEEHVVEEQPACGETLCSVEDFRAKYQHILDFDWDSECPV